MEDIYAVNLYPLYNTRPIYILALKSNFASLTMLL
uniref:Uncharacterized protein n=1 Tax=Rhizophora mucronata TaxID=61149 RepID=A0A2P2QTC4_RHIMU